MNVGDYVRTKDGHIDKIVKISDEMKSGRTIKVQIGETDNIGGYEDFVDWFSPSHFIESSPNIIDLIEKNDLVIDNYGNIYVVDYVFDNYVYTTAKQGNITKTLCDYQIKEIVTKEQFESRKYEVK